MLTKTICLRITSQCPLEKAIDVKLVGHARVELVRGRRGHRGRISRCLLNPCCVVVKEIWGKSIECIGVVMLSNTARQLGVKIDMVVTILNLQENKIGGGGERRRQLSTAQ
jgi:hypothetical protein